MSDEFTAVSGLIYGRLIGDRCICTLLGTRSSFVRGWNYAGRSASAILSRQIFSGDLRMSLFDRIKKIAFEASACCRRSRSTVAIKMGVCSGLASKRGLKKDAYFRTSIFWILMNKWSNRSAFSACLRLFPPYFIFFRDEKSLRNLSACFRLFPAISSPPPTPSAKRGATKNRCCSEATKKPKSSIFQTHARLFLSPILCHCFPRKSNKKLIFISPVIIFILPAVLIFSLSARARASYPRVIKSCHPNPASSPR